MLIDIRRLLVTLDATEKFQSELVIDDNKAGDGIMFDGPVKTVGTIYNQAGVVFLKAKISAVIKAQCARCLSPAIHNFELDISHLLVREIQDESNEEMILIEGDTLDVDDLVFQSIVLNLPMRFLCREDCKGVCPICGVNNNTQSCHCCDVNVDPRLEALRKLIIEEK